jgi:DNA/RNA endonuclease G (NUC1)
MNSLSLLSLSSLPDVWIPLEQLLRSWARNFSTIHVILGPVLDTDRDGRRDSDASYSWWVGGRTGGVAIPTHFYAVLTRCGSGSGAEPADCDLEQLDTVGMLFQHPTEVGVSNIFLFCVYVCC